MKKSIIRGWLYLAIFGLIGSSAVCAEVMSNHELSTRVEQLEEKLNAEEGGMPAQWAQRITFSGVVEVEAGFASFEPDGGESEDESDIAVATVELGVGAKIADHVSGDILFLYEDGEDIVVDEAVITIDGEDVLPLYLRAGEMYVPFGSFESHMISDPLTLEIGETREAAIQLGAETGGIHGSIFLFNGDVDEADADDNHIDNFGAEAGYTMESDALSVDAGVSYINDLMDADGFEDVFAEGAQLNEYAAGLGAYVIVSIGPATIIGEYVAAMDDIELLDEAGDTVYSEKIAAWNAEAGFGFAIGEREATVAIGYQGTDKAENMFPETRYLGTFGLNLFENTALAIEYLHDEYENDDEADTFTAQLAIEF